MPVSSYSSDAAFRHGAVASPLDAAITQRDKNILAMVEQALKRDDLLLAYQPVVDCADPNRIAFYEGLIRIIDDTGRIIPAAEFIESCETSEIGRMIDCASLRMGLEALATCPWLRLSINMSARTIGYSDWNEVLDNGLKADPTVAERLILEITESSAMILPELTRSFMERQQMRGIAFAIDDFGMGYTSFRYLRDFDFDILKIASEFIAGVADHPDNQVLTQALVSIARHFDMFTVAEAAETDRDAELLRELGVDCIQAYLFGVPTTRPPWEQERSRPWQSAGPMR